MVGNHDHFIDRTNFSIIFKKKKKIKLTVSTIQSTSMSNCLIMKIIVNSIKKIFNLAFFYPIFIVKNEYKSN